MATLRIMSIDNMNIRAIANVIGAYTGASASMVYDLIDSVPTTITNLDPEDACDAAEELRELDCEVEEIV